MFLFSRIYVLVFWFENLFYFSLIYVWSNTKITLERICVPMLWFEHLYYFSLVSMRNNTNITLKRTCFWWILYFILLSIIYFGLHSSQKKEDQHLKKRIYCSCGC
ncbi:hypothetical protein K1719_017671 [Acacia pycnantha]|nr:hypothetical protein K1719_017671 [Acacia pycnantha]